MPEKEKIDYFDFLRESMKKKPEKAKPLIFVDTREQNSGVVQALAEFDCVVKEKMLNVADYLCSDRVAIERKTSPDLVSSIMDQRLFKQLSELKQNFEKPVLLIEGNNFYERITPNALRGALASVALDFSIPILWTRDEKETAGMIFWLARREQFDSGRELAIRGEKKERGLKQMQEFLVAGLPEISNTRARALLKKFSTPERIFMASREELKEVDGVGEKIAQKIRDVLHKDYE